MNTPKYTFLLPAYKAKFFAEALESIKNQTYKDFICLVSDDCSPEDLNSVFDEVVGDDPRFTFRRNAENMGGKSLVSHWNLLVDMCDTEFLIMASDDDVYEPNFLEEIDALTSKYPQVDLFRGRVRKINGNGVVFDEDDIAKENEGQIEFLYNITCRHRIYCIANYVFKTRSLKQKNGFVDFPLAWGSDDATEMIMSENGCCNTNSIVFSFRQSDSNISSTINKKIIETKFRARLRYLQYVQYYLGELSDNESILSHHRLNTLIAEHNRVNYRDLKRNVEFYSYKSMKDCYIFLGKHGAFNGVLDKIHYLWTWIRAQNR